MSVKTNTYLSKVIAGLAKEGGGHNIESAFFEQPDNSIDADASEIIIAYSESKYVFINADNGTGTTDILSLWGCGNIVSKSQSEIGKKMIGELAASLYYQPTNLRYKSVCNSDIPNQYAHIDLANIMSIVSKPDKLQKEANEANEESDMTQLLKQGAREEAKQDIQDDREGEIEGDEILENLGGATYKENLEITLRNIKEHANDFLTPEALQTYSPKFLAILENIKDPDYIGLHLVYSQFRTAEGVGIFSLVLNKNGFARFKIKKLSLI